MAVEQDTTQDTTLVALSTAPGGAIGVVRLSGRRAIEIAEGFFSKPLGGARGYSLHLGTISAKGAGGTVSDGGRVIDEALVTLFRAPHSYTGEDMVEISCHGSPYIIRHIIELAVRGGATPAGAGEFTQRAFLNGKLDLSQAEAVADLIAAEGAAAHRIAMEQMRGGYTHELAALREKLLHITALLELELDFSEEDVEFADRTQLVELLDELSARCGELIDSFQLGNVLKNGIPVAIVGEPNAGKSTLLNRLLGEERAIVSDIAGTTRDYLEETLTINGLTFRFVDTAGLRSASDELEAIGIERTRERISRARIVLLLIPPGTTLAGVLEQVEGLGLRTEQKLIILLSKSDLWEPNEQERLLGELQSHCSTLPILALSAKQGLGVTELGSLLVSLVGYDPSANSAPVVSNARHHSALRAAAQALSRARTALEQNLSADLVSEEIRQVLHHLGTITGAITTDDILGHIFSKFCIGK